MHTNGELARAEEGRGRAGGSSSQGPQRSRALLFLVVSFAAMTGLLLGYDLTVVSVVLEPVRNEFNVCGQQFSCLLKELFVAMPAPGAVVGSLYGGVVARRLGRLPALGISDALLVVAALLMCLGPAYWILLVGRFFVGLGVGVGMVVFSTYTSEVSPTHLRGRLGLLQEICQCIGCIFTFGTAALMVDTAPYWRWLLAIAGIVGAVQCLGLSFLPESPRWLMSKDRKESARRNMRRLGVGSDEEIEELLREMEEERDRALAMKQAQENARVAALHAASASADASSCASPSTAPTEPAGAPPAHQSSDRYQPPTNSTNEHSSSTGGSAHAHEQQNGDTRPPRLEVHSASGRLLRCVEGRIIPGRRASDEMFTAQWLVDFAESFRFVRSSRKGLAKLWRNRAPLFVALGCAVAQNMMAAPALLPYSTDIFMLAGVKSPYVAGVGIGVAKTTGVLITFFLIETLGRKGLLLIGTLGTTICHIVLALSFLPSHPSWPTTAACAMIVFMFFWNMSWAGLMYVVASEVLPQEVRSLGMGCVITTFWVFAFIIQSTLESMFTLLTRSGTFFFYACTNALLVFFILFCIPETTGRTLEEISASFYQQSTHDKDDTAMDNGAQDGSNDGTKAVAGTETDREVVR